MEKRKRARIISLIILLTSVFCGTYLVLSNLENNIVFFRPPSELNLLQDSKGKVRVGGTVKNGSVKNLSATEIKFVIADSASELEVVYQGILPALFAENNMIIAEGNLVENSAGLLLVADKLLAKHDENYMPPKLGKKLQ